MGWVLVILAVWFGQPFTLQIPMATKAVCETAKAQALADITVSRDDPKLAGAIKPFSDIVATCLETRED